MSKSVKPYPGNITERLMINGWHEVGTAENSRWYHPHVFGGHTPDKAVKIMQDNADLPFWDEPSVIKERVGPDFLKE